MFLASPCCCRWLLGLPQVSCHKCFLLLRHGGAGSGERTKQLIGLRCPLLLPYSTLSGSFPNFSLSCLPTVCLSCGTPWHGDQVAHKKLIHLKKTCFSSVIFFLFFVEASVKSLHTLLLFYFLSTPSHLDQRLIPFCLSVISQTKFSF